MIAADPPVGTVTAVAVNVAETFPAATVTDAGTDSSPVLLVRATVAPPTDAVWFSETVQVDEAPTPSDVGLQEIPVTAGKGTVMAPPVPVTEIGPPGAVVANRFVSPIGELSAAGVVVTVNVATGPLCIKLSFMPESMHV